MGQRRSPISRKKKGIDDDPEGGSNPLPTDGGRSAGQAQDRGPGTYTVSRKEWMDAVFGDIDPAKHAGEGHFATDEYFPQDIDNPYTRGDVTGYGDYYPGPDPSRRAWPPYRG